MGRGSSKAAQKRYREKKKEYKQATRNKEIAIIDEQIKSTQADLQLWQKKMSDFPNDTRSQLRVEAYEEKIQELQNKRKQLENSTGERKLTPVETANLSVVSYGKSWDNAPANTKTKIQEGMKLSKEMQDSIGRGDKSPVFDVWNIQLKGSKEKRILNTKYVDGKIEYTLKAKNRILLKTTNKDQMANQIAGFLNSETSRIEKEKQRERKRYGK